MIKDFVVIVSDFGFWGYNKWSSEYPEACKLSLNEAKKVAKMIIENNYDVGDIKIIKNYGLQTEVIELLIV